jgi:hypothetical protein
MKHEYDVHIKGGVATTYENGETHWTNSLTAHSLTEVMEIVNQYPDWFCINKLQFRRYDGKMRWVVVWRIENLPSDAQISDIDVSDALPWEFDNSPLEW